MEAIDYHYVTDEDMKKLLDAEWNKAIEMAAESAEIEEFNSCAYRVNKQSILKLKR